VVVEEKGEGVARRQRVGGKTVFETEMPVEG